MHGRHGLPSPRVLPNNRAIPELEMALGLLGWVWDINQDPSTRDAHAAARSAGSTADAAASELAALRESVDRLALMNQALWELFRDHAAIQERDLLARIESIDLRDGVLDGRIGVAVAACPACGRPNRSQRPRCLYCGVSLSASASPIAPIRADP